MISRRTFVKQCCASAVGLGVRLSVPRNQDVIPNDSVTEDQCGDPDGADEYVTFSPSKVRQIATSTRKATFERWDANLPVAMIVTARAFIGYNRRNTPQEISKFLGLFDLPLSTENGYVPFCAAGASYCGLVTYANRLAHTTGASPGSMTNEKLRKIMPDLEHYYFYPTVSCVDMYHIAAGKRKWVAYSSQTPKTPKAGWIVLFDWKKRGIPDHCGLIQQATKETLATIEFNTSIGEGSQKNGGTVAQKTRSYEFVTGFVKTDATPS